MSEEEVPDDQREKAREKRIARLTSLMIVRLQQHVDGICFFILFHFFSYAYHKDSN